MTELPTTETGKAVIKAEDLTLSYPPSGFRLHVNFRSFYNDCSRVLDSIKNQSNTKWRNYNFLQSDFSFSISFLILFYSFFNQTEKKFLRLNEVEVEAL